MKTHILEGPTFIHSAVLGTGLSYGKTSDMELAQFQNSYSGMEMEEHIKKVCLKLAHLPGGGHNKFLEVIHMTLDVNAPRFWWSEFDTYRIGVTRLSESTMHTLNKRPVYQSDFEYPIEPAYLLEINDMIYDKKPLEEIKSALPEGFLQRRIVGLNAKALKNIYEQRRDHKLPQWHRFLEDVRMDLNKDRDSRLVKEMVFGGD